VEAVVMAAGEGRRLRPLTERWAKPVLPIDGRPVLAMILRELADAGLRDVWIVVGHLAGQIEALVGDGAGFGLEVRYARQPEALGSADAVARALEAGARAPLLAVVADVAYTPGAVARALAEWRASGTSGGLAVRHVPASELPERSSVRVEGGRLLEVVEKPPARPETAAGTAPAGAGLWFFDAELAASIPDAPGPPHELASVLQRAIEAGREVAALEVGPTRDITRPEDVMTHNFPYLWSLERGEE
jgi:NDP-sugar pyrophosphorylase family protein